MTDLGLYTHLTHQSDRRTQKKEGAATLMAAPSKESSNRLYQSGQSLFDAAKGFTEEVFAGGVAETDAVVVAEGRAHNGGHVGFIE